MFKDYRTLVLLVALVPLAQVDQLAWLFRPQVPTLLAAPSLSFENVLITVQAP